MKNQFTPYNHDTEEREKKKERKRNDQFTI